MKNMGQRIKELRKKNDMTQERLADCLGVTYKAVSKWECGLTMPDVSLIVPLSRVLHVSADELLSGKPEEVDKRRAEFDKHCDNWTAYNEEENYKIALQAVSEYPRDYKYLLWLAHTEMNMSHRSEYIEDKSLGYSANMLERAIEHNNIVIGECADYKIREKAIWNAMVCCKTMNRYDEAVKYAEMFPDDKPITRNRAMELCLQGEQLNEHRKSDIYRKTEELLMSLSRSYWFSAETDEHVKASLDATEALLETLFPDGNYLGFYKYLCCVYQTRAALEVTAGNPEKAIEYLLIMLECAKKIPYEKQSFTCGVLSGFSVDYTSDHQLPYMLIGLDDTNQTIVEQLKNRVKKIMSFAPLWDREDFKSLFE